MGASSIAKSAYKTCLRGGLVRPPWLLTWSRLVWFHAAASSVARGFASARPVLEVLLSWTALELDSGSGLMRSQRSFPGNGGVADGTDYEVAIS